MAESRASASTIEQLSLGALLTSHKQHRGIGDARLATLANDRVGIANFVTRSTIRNWASGNVARASNWRQLAAVASALQLDLVASDELMRSGGCDPISDLLRVARSDDAIHLVYWSTEADTGRVALEPDTSPSSIEATATQLSPDRASTEPLATEPVASDQFAPAPVAPEPVATAEVPAGEVELVDYSPLVAQEHLAIQQPAPQQMTTLSTWLAPFAFVVIGALAAVGLWYLAFGSGSAASSAGSRTAVAVAATDPFHDEALPDAETGGETDGAGTISDGAATAPTTTVDSPAPGATINGDLVASGTARHAEGIEHIELVIKNRDNDVYWNPVSGLWQSEFVRFTVPVETGTAQVAWSYRMPVPLSSGEYRVRAWARTSVGNEDPVGPLSDFSVVNNSVIAITPGAVAAPEGPNQLVVPVADTVPTSTLVAPGPGSVVGSDVVIEGGAQDPDGVAYVELILRRRSPVDEYWNPEIGAWQDEFIRFAVDVDLPGQPNVTWAWTPPESLDPGEYRARVWAKGSDGGRDEARTLSDFTVRSE